MSFHLSPVDESFSRGKIRIESEHYEKTSLEVSSNWTVGQKAAYGTRTTLDQSLIYVETSGSRYFTMSYDETTALRDRLTLLLNAHDEANPVASVPDVSAKPEVPNDRATAAMEDLAFRLDMFSTDDLVDALNRHTDALNNFNK